MKFQQPIAHYLRRWWWVAVLLAVAFFFEKHTVAALMHGVYRQDIAIGPGVTGVAWSPDGLKIAVTSDLGHKITILDPDGKVLHTMERYENGPAPDDSLAFLDSKRLLTPPNPPKPPPHQRAVIYDDFAFAVWDTDVGQFLFNAPGPLPGKNDGYNWARFITASPAGAKIAFSNLADAFSASLYSGENWQLKQNLVFSRPDGRPYGAYSLAFSPDGNLLALGVYLGLIQFIDPESGQLIKTIDAYLTNHPPGLGIHSLSFSPDGRYIVSGPDAGLGIATGPDGKPLPTNYVRVWRISDGAMVASYTGAYLPIRKVAWSPKGDAIAIASHNIVTLWKWQEPGNVAETFPMDGLLMSLGWSPDGNKLAAGNGDNIVVLNFLNP